MKFGTSLVTTRHHTYVFHCQSSPNITTLQGKGLPFMSQDVYYFEYHTNNYFMSMFLWQVARTMPDSFPCIHHEVGGSGVSQ